MVAAVSKAVSRDLAALAKLDPDLAESGLAATALALAQELDDSETSASGKAACARALTGTLEALHALKPAEAKRDSIDDIAKQRDKRLAAAK